MIAFFDPAGNGKSIVTHRVESVSYTHLDVYKRQTLSDPAVQNALKGISEEAATLRVLGNYEAQTDK